MIIFKLLFSEYFINKLNLCQLISGQDTPKTKKSRLLKDSFYVLGGRPDSNRRPLVPQTNALTN